MRRRALALFAIIFPLLFAACDATGLPTSYTPTPNGLSQATPTAPEASVPATDTPFAIGPTPTARATSTAGPTTSARNGERERVIEQVLTDTVALRGLQPQHDVEKVFITREQLRENLIRDLEEDYPKEEARQDAVEMWLLRLSDDRNLDLFQLLLDLYTEQIAGYYDPEEDELYVLTEKEALGPSERETLAHELVHALQDQHYDLDELLPNDSIEYDRDLARRSLVEGDATLSGVMYAYRYMTPEEFQELINESERAPSEVLDRVPTYIRESLIFPYREGADYVSQLIERGGFDRVNAALADLPTSTEQIIHPEKYLQLPRDEPIPVTIPPLTSTLGAGWTYRDGYSFGEFDFRVLLKEHGVANWEQASAGWGGAWTAFYENGDSALYVLDSRWDTTRDAQEFETALTQTLAKATKNGDLWSDDQGRHFSLFRSGDRVAFVTATEPETVRTALEAIR